MNTETTNIDKLTEGDKFLHPSFIAKWNSEPLEDYLVAFEGLDGDSVCYREIGGHAVWQLDGLESVEVAV